MLFSMCETMQIAVNSVINCSFFYYICCFSIFPCNLIDAESGVTIRNKLRIRRLDMNKGSIVERLCSDLDRKEPRYKSPTLRLLYGGRVVRCRTCDSEVTGSNPTNVCCVPTPTQRTIHPGSVNEYQRKLGVNGHTT